MRKFKIAVSRAHTATPKHAYRIIRNLLSAHCELVYEEKSPDIFFTCMWTENWESAKYHCPKILLTAEFGPMNRLVVDYGFSQAMNSHNNRNIFFEMLRKYENEKFWYEGFADNKIRIVHPRLGKLQDREKTKFCNFIYSNERPWSGGTILRKEFAQELMQYKKVDCPSKVLNNHPPIVEDGSHWSGKATFLSDYKFTIAFEPCKFPGYKSEKILHPFLVGSIPIYWGSPDITDYFNPDAFLNAYDYKTFDALIARIKAIDNDPALYQQYRDAPIVLPNSKLHQITPSKIAAELFGVMQKVTRPNYRPIQSDQSRSTRLKRKFYKKFFDNSPPKWSTRFQKDLAKTKLSIAKRAFIR